MVGKLLKVEISFGKLVEGLLPQLDRPPDDRLPPRQLGERLLVGVRVEGRIHPAGHRPRRVDALLREPLDDLLAELPQRDPVAQRVGCSSRSPAKLRFAGSQSIPRRRSGAER